jgi:ribonuclease D
MRTQATRSVTSEPLASSAEVAAAATLAREHGRIGIDTEFMSEGRYRALLCLVQIAVDDDARPEGEPRIDLIDPLEGEVDVTPIAQLLADPAIEVVLHAGRQDVAILRRAWGTEVTNIFDTQLAAGFVGASAQTGTCSGRCSAAESGRPRATRAGTRGR